MALEGLAAGVARERGLSRVHPDVLPQLVGRVEALLAVAALEGAHLGNGQVIKFDDSSYENPDDSLMTKYNFFSRRFLDDGRTKNCDSRNIYSPSSTIRLKCLSMLMTHELRVLLQIIITFKMSFYLSKKRPVC